jgi:hypothetical protein
MMTHLMGNYRQGDKMDKENLFTTSFSYLFIVTSVLINYLFPKTYPFFYIYIYNTWESTDGKFSIYIYIYINESMWSSPGSVHEE